MITIHQFSFYQVLRIRVLLGGQKLHGVRNLPKYFYPLPAVVICGSPNALSTQIHVPKYKIDNIITKYIAVGFQSDIYM